MQVDIETYLAVERAEHQIELDAMRQRATSYRIERDTYAAQLSKAIEAAAAEAAYDSHDHSENDE